MRLSSLLIVNLKNLAVKMYTFFTIFGSPINSSWFSKENVFFQFLKEEFNNPKSPFPF